MPILNYTTTISFEKTISEIQKCLVDHGAKKVIIDYDDNNLPCALTFSVLTKDGFVFFALSANTKGVLKALEKNRSVPRRMVNEEQALRVAWRIRKTLVEAQMACVESELEEMTEVFFSKAITKEGTTLFQMLKGAMGAVKRNSLMIDQGHGKT